MKHQSKGFSAIEALIIIIVLAVIGGIGVYVYRNRQSDSSNRVTETTPTAATSAEKADNKTLTDKFGDYSISYPKTWKLDSTKGNPGGNEYSNHTLTLPSGMVLNLKADWGGRGGMCEPDANDKPFKAGNKCVSKEFLTAEELPVSNLYYMADDGTEEDGSFKSTPKPAKLMLVTSRQMSEDTMTYYVGLTESTDVFPVKVKDPQMSLFFPFEYFTAYSSKGEFKPYIYAYAESKSASFLGSDDATAIKAALRTIKFNY